MYVLRKIQKKDPKTNCFIDLFRTIKHNRILRYLKFHVVGCVEYFCLNTGTINYKPF